MSNLLNKIAGKKDGDQNEEHDIEMTNKKQEEE